MLTNLGEPFGRDEEVRRILPDAEEVARAFSVVPPVRPGTPATFGVARFGGDLSVSMRYQPTAFPDAPGLFDLFARRIEDSASGR